jgi:ribosomal protein L39E
LPEGYLQTRLILMNYQTLRTIIAQRQNHRLPQWRMFIKKMKEQVKYKELLEGVNYE